MRIGQAIDMMKLQMAEMKELLEGKVHELQAKLAEEKKKSDSDVAQWKAMAQKELKTRLQVRWIPPSCLQLRLNLTWPHTHPTQSSSSRRRRRCRRSCRRSSDRARSCRLGAWSRCSWTSRRRRPHRRRARGAPASGGATRGPATPHVTRRPPSGSRCWWTTASPRATVTSAFGRPARPAPARSPPPASTVPYNDPPPGPHNT